MVVVEKKVSTSSSASEAENRNSCIIILVFEGYSFCGGKRSVMRCFEI